MPDAPPYFVPEVRDLTGPEKELVAWMVQSAGETGKPYLEQIPKLRVAGRCGCLGCPTVGFSVDGNGALATGHFTELLHCIGNTPEGGTVGVALYAREGLLSELEVYALAVLQEQFPLPTLESLKIV